MRLVVATVAMLLGAAILLPGATAPAASAQVAASPSVAPSASVEPSGSRLPDARVEVTVSTELEPNRDWTIAVTGGIASADVLTLGYAGGEGTADFTVSVFV